MIRVYVLAGGRGRRLAMPRGEKPLVRVGGRPMLARVLSAVRDVPSVDPWVVVSPATPRTEGFCRRAGIPVLVAPGAGYSADVGYLAQRTRRFATVSADLPFLAPSTLGRFLRAVAPSPGSRVGLLPRSRCRYPIPRDVRWTYGPGGRTLGRLVGINWVVARSRGADRPYLFDDPRLEFNVNRPLDLARARRWVRSAGRGARSVAASAKPDR